jgi:hypothetical protein
VPISLIDDDKFKFDEVGTEDRVRLGAYNDIEVSRIRMVVMKL